MNLIQEYLAKKIAIVKRSSSPKLISGILPIKERDQKTTQSASLVRVIKELPLNKLNDTKLMMGQSRIHPLAS